MIRVSLSFVHVPEYQLPFLPVIDILNEKLEQFVLLLQGCVLYRNIVLFIVPKGETARNISREITPGPADCSTFSSNLVPFPVCVSSILLSMNILPTS